MSENTFHHFAHEHINEEVTIITRQGNFEGRLLVVGSDVVVLQSNRIDSRQIRILIRTSEIVAFHRSEVRPRGPFGFLPPMGEFEEQHESSDHL